LRLCVFFLALLAAPPLLAGSLADLAQGLLGGGTAASGNLPTSEIADAIRQALAKGTTTAVQQLGHKGGFWGNPRFQIPLPGPVARLQGALDRVGAGAQLDQLHEAINRAAEQAVPVAANVFGEAVKKLTLNDVRTILNGPKDAATQYFRRSTSATLTQKFEPIVARVTARTGLGQEYDRVVSSAGPLASMLGGNVDLNRYVTQQALNALFAEVATEEAAIRTDPAARTTALLKKVFGQGG
jgi:hypothetical protein